MTEVPISNVADDALFVIESRFHLARSSHYGQLLASDLVCIEQAVANHAAEAAPNDKERFKALMTKGERITRSVTWAPSAALTFSDAMRGAAATALLLRQ